MAFRRMAPVTLFVLATAFGGCSPTASDGEPGTQADPASTQSNTPAPSATPTRTPTPAPPAPSPTPSGPRELLPNLTPMPPDELYVQHDDVTSVRELRFSTLVANTGEGRLAMLGELQPDGLSSTAVQVIEREDGSEVEEPIGTFIYHQAHAHWHFQDFMVFELWTHRPGGQLLEMVRTTGKLTFCVVDNVPIPGFPDVDPNPVASECGSDLQAISRGWIDIYAADVPGQDLDLADLPDGGYALRTVIDPDNLVRESDETDNVDVTYIEIDDFQAQVADLSQVASEP